MTTHTASASGNNKVWLMVGVLALVVVLWITSSRTLGMGGPVILGLVLLNVFRILPWRDMQAIHWEVVLLYAGATAIGAGLASTGVALFLADAFVAILPDFMASGSGLAIASRLFTGLATNFMSDGATGDTEVEYLCDGVTETLINALREDGTPSLREDGIRKALHGLTTLQEVLAATSRA